MQRAAWKVATPGLWNSGTMATAGNLVFQGQADGRFNAYAADSGRLLWSFDAGNGMNGAPIAFMTGGKQYVAMLTGVGSAAGAYGTSVAKFGWQAHVHPHRLLVFALDGKAKLTKSVAAAPAKPIVDASFQVDAAKAQRGYLAYAFNCFLCHGRNAVGGGSAPDLRASAIPLSAQAFAQVVRDGSTALPMMPRFPELSDDDLDSIRHYLRAQANLAAPKLTKK
jgi:quinohemoprotein ethanol dehydrogenase